MQLLPKFVRLRDAPAYLAMDKNRFNREVRPNLIEIPIGEQGIAFDRLDLDAWADDYKSRNGKPCQRHEGELTWHERKPLVSSNEAKSGMSRKRSSADDFVKAQVRATSKKRNVT